MARGRRAATQRNMSPASITYDTLAGIEEVGAGDWIRMFLYSFPGWGKTSVWGTAAKAGMRVLVIRSSVDNMPARIMSSGAQMFTADTWEKMYEIQDFLRMSNHGYDWVMWDNVSTHEDVLLDDVWDGTVAAKPSREYLIGENGQIAGRNLNPSSGLDKGEYGRNMERIQKWVRHMVGCNSFHFAMGAHPIEGPHPTNDEGGDLLRPYVQGKQMTEKLTGYCNIVAFLEVMENEDQKWRRMHFVENPRFYAKDLYDAFLPKGYLDIVDNTPTIPKIMQAVEKARGEKLGTPTSVTRTPARRGRGSRR